MIKHGADWKRELSGHKKDTPATAIAFAMQKQGHDGALAAPEPEPSASLSPSPSPEPQALSLSPSETAFNPDRDPGSTLTLTFSPRAPRPFYLPAPPALPLSRRALHRASEFSPADGARLPENLGAREG